MQAKPGHETSFVPILHSVDPSLRLRLMDTVEGGFVQAGVFPPQVPAANPGYKMV